MGSLTGLVFLTFWGRRADRAGNVRIIQITSVLVPFVPVLWLISKQVYVLVFVETFASLAWAGFNLASVNFVYDAAPAEPRTQHIALFNALNGVAVCLGALAGGFMASRLPALFGFRLLTLFAISGVLRLAVVVLFSRSVVEVRHVPWVAVSDLIFGRRSIVGVRTRDSWRRHPGRVMASARATAERHGPRSPIIGTVGALAKTPGRTSLKEQ